MRRLLFLDTANREDVNRFLWSTAVSGVTTNPSLMAKEEKGSYFTKLRELAEVVNKHAMYSRGDVLHLSVEVITSDPEQMVEQAMTLINYLDGARSHIELFVKIPVLLDTLPVITKLSAKKVNVNATAIMTAAQAKLAEDAGAKIVSFFYNRIKDGGGDPVREIGRYVSSFRSSDACNIIAGSIRKPDDVLSAWEAGADIVTASPKIIGEMLSHPETDKAVKKFQEDIDSWLK